MSRCKKVLSFENAIEVRSEIETKEGYIKPAVYKREFLNPKYFLEKCCDAFKAKRMRLDVYELEMEAVDFLRELGGKLGDDKLGFDLFDFFDDVDYERENYLCDVVEDAVLVGFWRKDICWVKAKSLIDEVNKFIKTIKKGSRAYPEGYYGEYNSKSVFRYLKAKGFIEGNLKRSTIVTSYNGKTGRYIKLLKVPTEMYPEYCRKLNLKAGEVRKIWESLSEKEREELNKNYKGNKSEEFRFFQTRI